MSHTMKENTIYLENCLTWMRQQPDEIVDLTVTSPPYDKLRTYKKKGEKAEKTIRHDYGFEGFEDIAKELYRITKTGGIVVWVVADETIDGGESGTSFSQALFFKEVGFKLHDTMIYEKNTSSFPSSERSTRYTQIFEYMFVFSKGKPKTVNLFIDKPNKWGGWSTWGQASKRTAEGSFISIGIGKQAIKEKGVRTNIWRYVCSGGYGQLDKRAYKHPATFPDLLAEDHIKTWSNPGDLVFDPFAGSGTTPIVATRLGRNYVACELSQEYYDLIIDRINNPCTKTRKKSETMECPTCKGWGFIPQSNFEVQSCLYCDGAGEVSKVQPKDLLARAQKQTEKV